MPTPSLRLRYIVSEKRDYYEVLGVARDADNGTIKRAYRALAVKFHPDKNQGDAEAEARFKEASEAYQVLSDREKRQSYDQFGHDGPRGAGFGGGFSDVGDIFSSFSDIFGDVFGGGRRGAGASRGSDLEAHVQLTLAEAAEGVEKRVEVERHVVCGTCNGSGAEPGTQPERCPRCDGRGQVVHAQGFMMVQSTCPVCRGRGTIIKNPCKTCDGAGLVGESDAVVVQVPAGVEDGATLRLTGRGDVSREGATWQSLHPSWCER